MPQFAKIFIEKGEIKAKDLQHRKTIQFNIGKYNAVVPKGQAQFLDLEKTRKMAKNKKWFAIENLDNLLESFEQKITQKGAKVFWALDAAEALSIIDKICTEKNCKTIVKSKSMVTEEIHLNQFLATKNIESIETDLGEYIQQLDGEPPYHIVTPAMHKSKEDIAQLFAEKLNIEAGLSPEQLTLVAREKLREKYAAAEIGITGANFIIPDIGGIALTENEGNGRLSLGLPKTHIVIVGIEKIIPSMADLSLFWPLLASYGTGQKLTVYNSIITGPRQINETDGPEDLMVILLDNGRTNLLADTALRQSMYCIRCGACLNACPIYKTIGGHSYGTTYSGPIGKVITPHLKSMQAYGFLSYASTLCGACTAVCPVRIDLHELLLVNRKENVQENNPTWKEKWAWKIWKNVSLNRALMNSSNGYIKTKFFNLLFKNWSKERAALHFPRQSFSQMWKQRN